MSRAAELRAACLAAEAAGDSAEEVNEILGYLEEHGCAVPPEETEQGISGQTATMLDRFLDDGWDPAETPLPPATTQPEGDA